MTQNADPFNSPDYLPVLSTVGLKPVDESLPVRLSILLAFNDFRRSQIARSLECLARQNWREFEVLIHDNGSSLPMGAVYEKFRPYLRLRTMRAERDEYRACPTFGVKELLPLAKGEVIAMAQPEIMLAPDAAWLLYFAHSDPPQDSLRYIISNPGVPMGGRPTWVALKVGFLNASHVHLLDGFNWHIGVFENGVKAVEDLPGFWTHTDSLGCLRSQDILAYQEWPWWFVGSTLRSDRLWNDMPVFKVNATIDFWLLAYRHILGYVDIVPPGLYGYHQEHLRILVPDTEGEAAAIAAPMVRRWAWLNRVPQCPAADPGGADLSPVVVNPRSGSASVPGVFIKKESA